MGVAQLPWAEVKKEMTIEKGLDESVADKIGEYVMHKGISALLLVLCNVLMTFVKADANYCRSYRPMKPSWRTPVRK